MEQSTFGLKPGERYLSPQEIKNRLDAFNATGDWSAFHDVPEIQQVDVMYPHYIDAAKILAK